jgi:hypothetical protein
VCYNPIEEIPLPLLEDTFFYWVMHTKQDTEKNASRMLLYLICEGGSAKADHHTTKHREPKEGISSIGCLERTTPLKKKERKGKANANIYQPRRGHTVHERPVRKLSDGKGNPDKQDVLLFEPRPRRQAPINEV